MAQTDKGGLSGMDADSAARHMADSSWGVLDSLRRLIAAGATTDQIRGRQSRSGRSRAVALDDMDVVGSVPPVLTTSADASRAAVLFDGRRQWSLPPHESPDLRGGAGSPASLLFARVSDLAAAGTLLSSMHPRTSRGCGKGTVMKPSRGRRCCSGSSTRRARGGHTRAAGRSSGKLHQAVPRRTGVVQVDAHAQRASASHLGRSR